MMNTTKAIVGSEESVNAVIDALNESTSTVPAVDGADNGAGAPTQVTCAVCGANFKPEVAMEGADMICPVCGSFCDPAANPGTDANIDDPDTVNGLDVAATDYANAIKNENYQLARQILQESNATAQTMTLADGSPCVMLEAFKIKVDASGKKSKVKIKSHKKRLSSKQKMALKKARKSAHKGGADKKRAKAMRKRKSMGLSDSFDFSMILAKNIGMLTESLGHAPSADQIKEVTDKVQAMKEALIPEDDKIMDNMLTLMRERDMTVVDSDIEPAGSGYKVTMTVVDNDVDLYLSEYADEVEFALGNVNVAYTDPQDDPDDETLKVLTFLVIPTTTESCKKNEACKNEECTDPECSDPKTSNEAGKKNEAGKNEECDPRDPACNTKKTNESIQYTNDADNSDEAIDSIAGGTDNILCSINPAFIKPGQIVYDTQDKTVFTVLTEPVMSTNGFEVAIEVLNSENPDFVKLPKGASVTLIANSDYRLLKKSPVY
jgi:hypothetical protein